MQPRILSALAFTLFALHATLPAPAADFDPPVRLEADGAPVQVEKPGYAAPCWADIDGDGHHDLLVGQFAGGKIRVFRNLGDRQLAAGEWLQAEGEVAEVPGIW